MVAKNPLFHGRWTIKKFNATVINDIWPEVFFFTLIATSAYIAWNFLWALKKLTIFAKTVVTLVTQKTDHSLSISNQLLTVLGTVLGLVISFRTSSAYERFVSDT
jgi:Bestrophin.